MKKLTLLLFMCLSSICRSQVHYYFSDYDTILGINNIKHVDFIKLTNYKIVVESDIILTCKHYKNDKLVSFTMHYEDDKYNRLIITEYLQGSAQYLKIKYIDK